MERIFARTQKTTDNEFFEENDTIVKSNCLNTGLKPNFGLNTPRHGSDNIEGLIIAVKINLLIPAWAKGLIRYFVIFHYRATGSNLRFRKHKKLLEGEDIHVRPTLSSRLSRYQVMVNSQGVLSRNN